jgi:hypothetical protein
MRRHPKCLGLAAVAAAGLLVISCNSEVPTEPEATTRSAATPQAPPTAPAPSFAYAPGATSDNCIEDVVEYYDGSNAVPLNCTANDVDLAIVVLEGENPVECFEGDPVTVNLDGLLEATSDERYDIALWIALDGGNARTGSCYRNFLDGSRDGLVPPDAGPYVPDNGPWYNGEYDEDPGDTCGDLEQGVTNTIALGAIEFTCRDSNGDGSLDVGSCVSWDNGKSAGTTNKPSCTELDEARPNNKAKCYCGPLTIPVDVKRQATVTVKKVTDPTDDPGRWNLEVLDWEGNSFDPAATAANVGNGGEVSQQIVWVQDDEPTENNAYVKESAGEPNPGAQFFSSTYECKAEGGAGAVVASGSGMGPVKVGPLSNGDDVECVFTNTRLPIPSITIDKTVVTSYDRAWDWEITKDVFPAGSNGADPCDGHGESIRDQTLTLSLSEQYVACYEIVVTPKDGYPLDGNISASGVITATFTGYPVFASTSLAVSDMLDGNAATVENCSASIVDLSTGTDAGDGKKSVTVTCDWSYGFTTLPTTTLTNVPKVDVTWNSGDTDSKSGSKSVTFGAPTTESDEMFTAYDTFWDQPEFELGTGTGVMKTFSFDRALYCPDYGTTLIENDARFATNDTPLTGTASADLSVKCDPPPTGCTLTQGYWKTHSEFGPAPFDEDWNAYVTGNEIAGCDDGLGPDPGLGASVEFLGSGVCHFDIMWTPPKGGNSYYQLAHQYIAAMLNVAGGAQNCVETELAQARALLAKYDSSRRIRKKSEDEALARSLASTLASYNEGDLCAPHCDSDGQGVTPY